MCFLFHLTYCDNTFSKFYSGLSHPSEESRLCQSETKIRIPFVPSFDSQTNTAGGLPPGNSTGDALLIEADKNDDQKSTFLQRRSTMILCLTLFLLPLVGMGAVKSLKVYASDVRQWLPSGFQEGETYDWFVEEFGIDEMVVLSWPGCTLDDPRVPAMREALEEAADKDGLIFQRCITGPDMLRQLKSAGVSSKTAMKRIRGLMVGPDNQTTVVVAYPVERLLTERRYLMSRVYEIAESEFAISPHDLKAGGPDSRRCGHRRRKQKIAWQVSLDGHHGCVSADMVSNARPAVNDPGDLLRRTLCQYVTFDFVLHRRQDEFDDGHAANAHLYSRRVGLCAYRQLLSQSRHDGLWASIR